MHLKVHFSPLYFLITFWIRFCSASIGKSGDLSLVLHLRNKIKRELKGHFMRNPGGPVTTRWYFIIIWYRIVCERAGFVVPPTLQGGPTVPATCCIIRILEECMDGQSNLLKQGVKWKMGWLDHLPEKRSLVMRQYLFSWGCTIWQVALHVISL